MHGWPRPSSSLDRTWIYQVCWACLEQILDSTCIEKEPGEVRELFFIAALLLLVTYTECRNLQRWTSPPSATYPFLARWWPILMGRGQYAHIQWHVSLFPVPMCLLPFLQLLSLGTTHQCKLPRSPLIKSPCVIVIGCCCFGSFITVHIFSCFYSFLFVEIDKHSYL